jgi:3-hydroxyacyl-CoA dehydrogenase/enoyl-CoA hydratase/3-hydroxybutyryl-CoA epimerase
MTNTEMAVTTELGSDGILVATMNLPGRPMNVLADALVMGLSELPAKLADPSVKGLILASGKADFCAGADLDRLVSWTQPAEPFEGSMALKKVLRAIETQGKPVVAAINGHALGGGLEIALACHARIAIDDPKLKLGQPEVKLGLLPGGGGTQRLLRLVGVQQAMQICAEGNDIPAAQARAMGLLADLARDRDELMAKARAWIAANPKAAQPWDQPRFKIPGGDSRSPAVAQMLAIAPSIASAKSYGNYPAVQHIMSCIFEGGLLDFDAACVVESRYFAACVMSREAKNMIGTLWFQLNAIKKGASRPAGLPRSKVGRLGILGAGMMGGGIAYVSAKAGIDVVLLDTTQEAADRGKAYSQGLLDKAVAQGRRTLEQRDALLARIRATTSYDDLKGCDLVIEAVFEDRAVKADVTKKAEAVLAADKVFASNTSTLPITGLAQASSRPRNFIGLHFFSPVDKMPLVEIIVAGTGPQAAGTPPPPEGDSSAGAAAPTRTSDETIARAFDYVLQIGKTPIVVNDSRGFYTSRVFATYVMEGIAMLREGVHPRSIEVAGLQAGMPMPPLALQDEVSLSLSLHVAEQTRKDLAAEGKTHVEHPGMAVIRQLCEIGRVGKKAGRGFYDYDAQGKQLWPELTTLYPVAARQPAQEELIDRLMFVQANEAARCHEEGVLRSVADANVGSIFGWGFAPFHGGALQFIDAMGAARFVERSRELAARHGARFEPAQVVVEQAASGTRFGP